MTEPSAVGAVDRKARLRIAPQPVPKQDPAQCVHNWEEVYLGYDLASAQIEASRCIQCPAAPCQKACPLHNHIAGALQRLEVGDPMGAAEVFRVTSILPDICGRLCPQERLCEGACVVRKVAKPVAIGKLEAFCADYEREHGGRPRPEPSASSGRRVAVVGSGPAGLAVAEELARRGHAVEVFEAWPGPGGLLSYGIPAFKLAKRLVGEHVEHLRRLGVQFHFNVRIGVDLGLEELSSTFDAIFLGHGAAAGNRLGVPGEELEGVYTATDFLVRSNVAAEELPATMLEPLHVGRQVVVIGGGDTAMDCARSAVRLGAAEVSCVYRRSQAEMTGRAEERQHAGEEGVRFTFQAMPVAILGGPCGRVRAVRFQSVELGMPDESGRARPLPVPGSEFELAADTLVAAVGYGVNRHLADSGEIMSTSQGRVAADERGATSRPDVFAAGDAVRGADLVVTALADASRAADAIDAYLSGVGFRNDITPRSGRNSRR